MPPVCYNAVIEQIRKEGLHLLTAMLTACGIEDADERELVQQLFFTYGRRVKALARHILHNEQDVEDALHDTFLKIIRYRKKFTDADPTETKRLIVILTKSVCFNLYRRKKRECDLFAAEDGEPDLQSAGEIDAIEAFLARESAARLRDAINTLAAPAREIVLLKYYSDLSNTEIAALLGIPASTVGTILWRSLKKIKERTEAYFCDNNG